MATQFLEGFDNYGPPSPINPTLQSQLLQKWTVLTSGGGLSIVSALGPTGYALSLHNSAVQKTLGSNFSDLKVGMRFQADLVDIEGIMFLSGAGSPANQCAISVNTGTGIISVRTGALGGTILASSSVSVTAGTVHYLEADVAFGSSAAFSVWLDGVLIITGTGNTAGGGGTTANVVSISSAGINNGTLLADDFYVFDGSGSHNNAVLNSNPFIVTQFPNGDNQTQWANNGSTLIPTGIAQTSVSALTSVTDSPGANTMMLVRCQAAVAETLNSIKLLPETTNAGAHFQPVVYADSAGSRGSILEGGAQVTGSVSGTTLNLPLSGSVSLGSGTFYWIGYFTDTNIATSQYDASTNLGITYTGTYGSGSGSFTGGLSTGQPTFLIWGDCTGAATNWESVDGNPLPGGGPGGDDASIQASTVNAQDFYNFPNLPAYVATAYAVTISENVKGVSGAPSVGCAILSVATTGYGSLGSGGAAPPSGSYGTIDSNFDTDPNGNIAWTPTNVNASKAGPLLV